MGDFTDHPRVSGSTAERAHSPSAAPLPQSVPPPLWRFTPLLRPAGVVRAIKTQILPRIGLALQPPPAAPQQQTDVKAVLGPVEAFAALALGPDDGAALKRVEDLLHAGIAIETVFLDLLAPTARYLGELWESDATDFANVTLGVNRLHRIMRQIGEAFCDNRSVAGDASALLTTIPGEQHSFGLAMAAEFFRRSGWNLCTGPFMTNKELTSLAQDRWFDVIGFSVTSDRRLDDLKRNIRDIRRDSRNRNVGILLGGPMMGRSPEIASEVGADMVAADAATAPSLARSLIELMKSRG
jgi:methanogenic corrinoid protein MtbC1